MPKKICNRSGWLWLFTPATEEFLSESAADHGTVCVSRNSNRTGNIRAQVFSFEKETVVRKTIFALLSHRDMFMVGEVASPF